MSLPASQQKREHVHTRTIHIDGYARDDGQWDLEAELIDVKSSDFPRHGKTHRAGDPVHKMQVRITFDKNFTITDAVAAYDAAPYQEYCFRIAPDYQDLIGLNLLRGFRQAVKQRFGRTAGCTHMSELTGVLPTAAVQTLAGLPHEQTGASTPESKKPFELDGCHALKLDGEVVRRFYPQWYLVPDTAEEK